MSQKFLSFFFFFVFTGSWEPEKAQGARKGDMPAKEEKGGNTEEEDGDVMDSHEPQEVRAVREEINLLQAEQCRMGDLKMRRGRGLPVWPLPGGCLRAGWQQHSSDVHVDLCWHHESSGAPDS